jgi:hypothetical protein
MHIAGLPSEVIGWILAAVWGVIAQVIIPIVAAAAAALFIGLQIRQLDRHREEDRRGEALRALNRLLYREVELSTREELWRQRAFLRLENEKELITAYSLLGSSNADVGRWAAGRRTEIRMWVDMTPAAKFEPTEGEMWTAHVGPMRAEAARLAAETVQELLLWQRGDPSRPTAWFSERLLNAASIGES